MAVSMKMYYILDTNDQPVPCDDILKWSAWWQTADRKVCETVIGDVKISTVFLGMDHSFGKGARPLLWETMVFGGEHDQFQDRTWDKLRACIMHGNAVNMVRESLGMPVIKNGRRSAPGKRIRSKAL